jgi:hypothetical protein
MNIFYKEAEIKFPEWFLSSDREFKENSGSINGDTVSFTRNGYGVSAEILHVKIPYIFSENPQIRAEIIEPAKELVSKDMMTIEKDLLLELRKLAKKEKIQKNLNYHKETRLGDDIFKVYENSGPRGVYSFERLMKLKKIPRYLLKAEYQNLLKTCRNLKQDKDERPYIEGKSLRQAVERALKILKSTEKSMEIYI